MAPVILAIALLSILTFQPVAPDPHVTGDEILDSLLRTDQNEHFLSFFPTGGFGNQVKGFRNALRLAGLLNRTLIIPPLMSHGEFEIGSCHDAHISPPDEAGPIYWSLHKKMFMDSSYISMADIVDISNLNTSFVRMIDMRLFAALRCGLDVSATLSHCAWCSPLIRKLKEIKEAIFPGNMTLNHRLHYCGMQLGYLKEKLSPFQKLKYSVYREPNDCRSLIFMFRRDDNGSLAAGLRNMSLLWGNCPGKVMEQKDWHNVVYANMVRRERKMPPLKYVNVVLYFGAEGSEARSATVLAVGNTFGLFDLQMPTLDRFGDALSCATQYLGLNPIIMGAGERFVDEKLPEPFACVHFRASDGDFALRRNKTLLEIQKWLNQKLSDVESINGSHGFKTFVMTDMNIPAWREEIEMKLNGTILEFGDKLKELEYEVHKNVFAHSNGILSNRLSSSDMETVKKVFWDTQIETRPLNTTDKRHNLLVYIQQSICSCSKRGFYGLPYSSLAINIRVLIHGEVCHRT